jgi:hypothetical protein
VDSHWKSGAPVPFDLSGLIGLDYYLVASSPVLLFVGGSSEKSSQTNRYRVLSVCGLFNFDRRTMTASGPLKMFASLATIMIVQFCATGAALSLALFRYEDVAQQHCPADSVVWLDFTKRKYYLSGQRLYGKGFHGSYVCLQEARESGYHRSLLGRR